MNRTSDGSQILTTQVYTPQLQSTGPTHPCRDRYGLSTTIQTREGPGTVGTHHPRNERTPKQTALPSSTSSDTIQYPIRMTLVSSLL